MVEGAVRQVHRAVVEVEIATIEVGDVTVDVAFNQLQCATVVAGVIAPDSTVGQGQNFVPV